MKRNKLLILSLVFFAVTEVTHADMTVWVDVPSAPVVFPEWFRVEIRADIPDPIVAWGLDLAFDDTILSLEGPPNIGSSFVEAFAADGDGLAALAFPTSVSGNDVLLATLDFRAIGIGTTDLWLSTTVGDLTEGFGLDPTGFAFVDFEHGSVTVTPIPAPAAVTLGVLGIGMVLLTQRRLQNKSNC